MGERLQSQRCAEMKRGSRSKRKRGRGEDRREEEREWRGEGRGRTREKSDGEEREREGERGRRRRACGWTLRNSACTSAASLALETAGRVAMSREDVWSIGAQSTQSTARRKERERREREQGERKGERKGFHSLSFSLSVGRKHTTDAKRNRDTNRLCQYTDDLRGGEKGRGGEVPLQRSLPLTDSVSQTRRLLTIAVAPPAHIRTHTPSHTYSLPLSETALEKEEGRTSLPVAFVSCACVCVCLCVSHAWHAGPLPKGAGRCGARRGAGVGVGGRARSTGGGPTAAGAEAGQLQARPGSRLPGASRVSATNTHAHTHTRTHAHMHAPSLVEWGAPFQSLQLACSPPWITRRRSCSTLLRFASSTSASTRLTLEAA